MDEIWIGILDGHFLSNLRYRCICTDVGLLFSLHLYHEIAHAHQPLSFTQLSTKIFNNE